MNKKKVGSHILIPSTLILMALNIFVFTKLVKMRHDSYLYEQKLSKLKEENILLENKLYQVSSLKYISTIAPKLGFVKQSEPVTLQELFFAYNK